VEASERRPGAAKMTAKFNILISFVPADKKHAERLAQEFRGHGLTVTMDDADMDKCDNFAIVINEKVPESYISLGALAVSHRLRLIPVVVNPKICPNLPVTLAMRTLLDITDTRMIERLSEIIKR
jgi:hypothetical protein